MSDSQIQQALNLAVSVIIDTIKDAGPLGAPSGPMYAALSAHGMTLNTYNSIIDALTRVGKIRQENHVLYLVK